MSSSPDIRQRLLLNGIENAQSGRAVNLKALTVTLKEIPLWQRDNDFILTGYRRVQDSWMGCIASVFGYLHNETVNILSHLIGAALFIFLTMTFNSSYLAGYPRASRIDTLVFAIFLICAIFCFLCSTIYHTATCHSEAVSAHCHAFDYAGIVVLTVGSFFPCIYYGFFCQPQFQIMYLTAITLTGLGAAYIVLNPEYARPTHRSARTKVFIGLGLTAILPVSHLLASHGFNKLFSEMGFGWLLTSGSLYIGGALLYANRIPEKLYPGMFDYFFASHQIFHVCVVLAALAHYACILTAFTHWHSQEELCSNWSRPILLQ